jgi:hypothetical protein
MPIDFTTLKTKLWPAADELRANSRLRSHEYSAPVLGLIFLKYAGDKFRHVAARLEQNLPSPQPSPFGRGSETSPPLGGIEGGRSSLSQIEEGEGRTRRRAPGPEHYRAEEALTVPIVASSEIIDYHDEAKSICDFGPFDPSTTLRGAFVQDGFWIYD